MKIAVVGAGWAGLAAAFEAHLHGHRVTVYESGHRLGGRARSVFSPKLNSELDNGQHILLAAYTRTLDLMRRLGLDTEKLLYPMPLTIASADGNFSLRVPERIGPLAVPSALLLARGMSTLDKLRLVASMAALASKKWSIAPNVATHCDHHAGQPAIQGPTVAQWLQHGKQSQRMVRYFWEPLCLAALNTPIDRACAQLFANVLRDSLGAGPEACRVLIPRVDLSTLWPEHLPPEISIARGHTVRQIVHGDAVHVDQDTFDAVIIATNAPSAGRLLEGLPSVSGADAYIQQIQAFQSLPIATLTLDLTKIWDMPEPMLMLTDSPDRAQFGQWLFHCNTFLSTPLGTSRVNVVISHARDLSRWTVRQIVEGVITQIKDQTSRYAPMPSVRAFELITEKRATFAAVPGLQRPKNTTPWKNVFVAGDWTDTDYPAVLEGAVRSGISAARQLSQGWSCDN